MLVAVTCYVVVCGMAFVAWQALQMSRAFGSADRKLDSVAASLLALAELRQQERQENAQIAASRVIPAAVDVVFDGTEVFPARPETGEIGIGLFTMRNVGHEAVFLLGITRTATADIPPGPALLLPPADSRDLSLRLDPGDPPLDEGKVTAWYRDLTGRHWARSLGDLQATPMPAAPAVGQAAGEPAAGQPEGRELPAADRRGPAESGGHE